MLLIVYSSNTVVIAYINLWKREEQGVYAINSIH